jgi:bacillithiol biosynthesis cysteine-adding enzyme BshC
MIINYKKISCEETNQFSKLIVDYFNNREELRPFFNQHFSKPDIHQLIHDLNFNEKQRIILSDELMKQYDGYEINDETKKNILKLQNKNTFTITTGHQLCLFTGPLYFIYKIISVINQCEEFNLKYPEYYFVPVFWMAGEDHDREEINHTHVYGKKIIWDTDQKGKVGNFNTTGIEHSIAELNKILGNSIHADELITLLKKAYSLPSLNDATRFLVNQLFGKYGLVILNPDSEKLKNLFVDEIKNELKNSFVKKSVDLSISKLNDLGYKIQVNPREINLFYAKNGIRERIVFSEDYFRVNNTEIKFSDEEIDSLINNEIQVFSPNVLMRPLYQQKLLPNIVYVGGPGEIAYWLQLKNMFEASSVFFPIIQPRKFALIMNEKHILKWQKTGLNIESIFLNNDLIEKKYISFEHEEFNDEKIISDKLFDQLRKKTESIDKTLVATVEAEKQKLLKSIDFIEQKIKRAIKQNNETNLKQISSIKNIYFPQYTIQERFDSIFNFISDNENAIDELKKCFSETPCNLTDFMILLQSNEKISA